MNFPNLTLQPFKAEYNPVLDGALGDYLAFYNMTISDEKAVDYRIGYVQSGDYKITCQAWKNSELTPKGTCVIVHGLYDHTGLYGGLIRHCLSEGYSVLALDLPGHGLSSGYPTAIDSFQEYVDALLAAIDGCEEFVGAPYIGIGQSTGGAVLATAKQQQPELWQKLILLAPLFYPCKWKIGSITYKLFSRWVRSIPRNFKASTHDVGFSQFVKEDDPLQAKRLSLTWIKALMQWQERFYAEAAQQGPTLFIQGDDDRTVEWKKNRIIYKTHFPELEEFIIHKGRHHLVNEAPFIRDQVFSAISRFLQR